MPELLKAALTKQVRANCPAVIPDEVSALEAGLRWADGVTSYWRFGDQISRC